MATEPCIACGGTYYGTRRSFPLCKEHWDATAAIEEREQADGQSYERLLRQQEFARTYPLPITRHRVAPPNATLQSTSVDDRLILVIARFLHYSWKDIGFKYSELSDQEKKLCSKTDFGLLVEWVKRHNK